MLSLCAAHMAQVRRPATVAHSLTFEDLSTTCDFAAGEPISTEYAARFATFSGPGFGALNGGVPAHACALSGGGFPPLGNASFSGSGFLAFSTLHAFHGSTGKPVSPETVRFDVRVTNLRMSFAGIDGHEALVELWSGPSLSYNDRGHLLASYRFPMTAELQAFDMVDENGIYVDCVRRAVVSSSAKLFVLDNFFYEVSAAGDGVCAPVPDATGTADDADGQPSAAASEAADAAAGSEASSASPASAIGASALAWALTAAVVLHVHGLLHPLGLGSTSRVQRSYKGLR